MSDIPVNPMDPGDPVPTTSTTGEGVAERYVDHELVTSRASLRRTQIVGSLLALFVLAYMGYLTSGFRASLEPNGAAQIATGLATQRLDDMEPQFADYIHTEVPKMIRSAPDEVIKRLPEYRQELEKRVDTAVRAQAQQGAAQLDKQLGDFLEAHKEQVGNLLKNGQDPANLQSVGDGLETSFKEFLGQKIGAESIQEKLDQTLVALKQVSSRTAKLAANKGLTPEEAKARHAVAMLMDQIGAARAANPDSIPSTDAIKAAATQAANDLTDTVKSNMPANTGTTPAAGDEAATGPATAAAGKHPASAPVKGPAASSTKSPAHSPAKPTAAAAAKS